MSNEVETFFVELMQDVSARAEASGAINRTVFVEGVARRMIEAEEFQEWLPSFHDGRGYRRRAIQVDGYSAESLELDGTLHLLVADFRHGDSVEALTTTQVKESFSRVYNFFEDAHEGRLHEELEPSTPAADLARLIFDAAGAVRTVRIHVLSNALLGSRFKESHKNAIDGINAELRVWDLSRMYECAATGSREPLEIDFTALPSGGLPCLKAGIGDTGYAAYLCVMPATVLAEVYEEHGTRLLEGNVRAFLSARVNVNKGIRRTILNEPSMFFAFNNGITATAVAAEVVEVKGQALIRKLTDLQIVNGGQTTASLFNARTRDKAELGEVFVQMKLSVLPGDVAQGFIPDIARYANTQNKVSDADLFANHPFHRRVEELSKRVWAPPRSGTQQQTHWFYERARAQYQTDVSKLNGAEKRAFQLKNPDNQVLEKTDLALYDNTWRKLPHVVSLGAQKNFLAFAETVPSEFDARPDEFNERWFQHIVAKAIVFRTTEDLVSNASWYPGGYRRNIVTYAIARVVKLIEDRFPRQVLDLDRIWKAQAVSPAVAQQLLLAGEAVLQTLVAPPAPWKNVTEWAKKDQCWKSASEQLVEVVPEFADGLKAKAEERAQRSDARLVAQEDDAIDVLTKAVQLAAGGTWLKALRWPRTRRLLSPTEFGILTAAATAKKTWVPSDLQARRLIAALKKLQDDGFA